MDTFNDLPTIVPQTWVRNITRGGILRYCPNLRSLARPIDVATTSWLHIENCHNKVNRRQIIVPMTDVEISNWSSRINGTGHHLHQLIGGDPIT